MGCSGSKGTQSSLGNQEASRGGTLLLDSDATSDGENQQRKGSVIHKAPEFTVSAAVGSPFDTSVIGTLTRHGIAPVPTRMAGSISKAKINQDRGMCCFPFNGTHNQALLCVFDGHGQAGERVSEWCTQQLPARLEADRDSLLTDTVNTLSRNIIQMDQDLLADPRIGMIARGAGTTSNVLYLHGDRLWTACSGDSRAVLGQRQGGRIYAVDLSRDHKPDLPDEQRRIERAGGQVSQAGPNGLPPSRMWVHGRVGLAMSRSIGDGEAKGHGVIPDPEVRERVIKPAADGGDGDAFIIVASDGIWEFISSEEACEIVAKHESATKACETLVMHAVKRWEEEEGSYRDDITCIIVYLPFLEDVRFARSPLALPTQHLACILAAAGRELRRR